jgi:hypothetical protein
MNGLYVILPGMMKVGVEIILRHPVSHVSLLVSL